MGARPHAPVRAWLELVRLPAIFTAPADVLAGLAIGGAVVTAPDAAAARVAALAAGSVAIYAAGMAANDLFDRRIDAEERPGRPLPSGRIGVGAAWIFVAVLQMVGIALALAGGGGAAALTSVGTVVLTYLYNGVLKHTALGPLAMGACRYGNAAIGLAATGTFEPVALTLPASTALYVTAVTMVSRHEAYGEASPALRRALVTLVAAALLPAAAVVVGALPAQLAALVAVLSAASLVTPVRVAWQGGAAQVRGAVRAGIFGIPLMNVALAVGVGRPGFALTILAFAALGRQVGRRFTAT